MKEKIITCLVFVSVAIFLIVWSGLFLATGDVHYDILITIRTVAVNISVLGSMFLIITYTRISIHRRTKISLALLLTSISLFVGNLIFNPLTGSLAGSTYYNVKLTSILEDVLTLTAVLSLLYVSRK